MAVQETSTLFSLPSSAVRLIGSGQVITSVYSVVKELFENSIDASSSNVDIRLDDFGLDRIEVSDNGKGVRSSDVPFMTKRHYTSKLSQIDDLLSLETYGFRGEALASLCAVSDVTITTKTKEDDVGSVYTFDCEGSIKSSKPSHLGTGTTVCARHLFQNLPVRKQCYKTSQKKKEDLRKIEDLLIVFAIAKPSVRIRLKHGCDVAFQKLPASDTKNVLHSVLGRQVASQLLYRDQAIPELQGSLSAFIPKPGSDVKTMSRSSNDRTFVVINDRPVHVKEIVRVLKQYYMNCHACESVRFPVCYISIKLPISDVDVNVDPNKTTVLLRPLNELCKSLEELLLQVYGPLDNVPSWHYAETGDKKANSEKKDSEKVNLKSHLAAPDNVCKQVETHRNEKNCLGDSGIQDGPQALRNNDNNNVQKEGPQTQPVSAQPVSHCSVPHSNKTPSAIDSNGMEFAQDDDLLLIDHVLENEFSVDAQGKNHSASVLRPDSHDESTLEKKGSEDSLLETDICKSFDSECTKLQAVSHTRRVEDSVNESKKTSDDWSRGLWEDGASSEIIQPVQLLAPTSKQAPGKRPLSPSEDLDKPVSKRRSSVITDKELPPGQQILPYAIESASSKSGKVPDDNEHLTVGTNIRPQKNKDVPVVSRNISKPSSIRDQIEMEASQSQADKSKRHLRQRLYHAEREVSSSMSALAQAVQLKRTESDRTTFEKSVVVGIADQCDAWICCYKSSMGIVNIHRLRETILYHRLKEKHRLPVTPLDQAIRLTSKNLSQTQLLELEKLGKQCHSENCFDITDDRLTANGFDVKCFFDLDGNFQSELYGLCNLVPTYSVRDLGELLDLLKEKPDSALADLRPTKVQYYLQGEAARMTLQNSSLKSKFEIQDMLDQLIGCTLETEKCFHHKSLFHVLCDLDDML